MQSRPIPSGLHRWWRWRNRYFVHGSSWLASVDEKAPPKRGSGHEESWKVGSNTLRYALESSGRKQFQIGEGIPRKSAEAGTKLNLPTAGRSTPIRPARAVASARRGGTSPHCKQRDAPWSVAFLWEVGPVWEASVHWLMRASSRSGLHSKVGHIVMARARWWGPE